MRFILSLLVATTLWGTANAAAAGDDQAKVQQSLASQGFSKWKRIELDNGVWEVDDAIDAAGKQFDLRVDANTLKITSKVAE